jgi:hypothetical protein
MKRKIAPVPLALTAALIVALAGCGGGGSSDPVAGAPTGATVPATRLAPNQAVESSFTADKPSMASIDPESGDASHCEAYEITLTTPGTLTVLMQSDNLDSYLQLFDGSFLDDPTDDTAFIASSDDAGTSLHALVSETLPAGTYVVVASTAYANAADTGTYSLMSLLTR